MSMAQIRIAGLAALMRELGPVGMVRFLQQFETGYGDYSKERHQWLDQWDFEKLMVALRERKEKKN
ncbi:MAG: hypothetical protein HY257_08040 [Chloroflexi bacterium]|nr:hypothetical protein [Chloroflexota bacterium]